NWSSAMTKQGSPFSISSAVSTIMMGLPDHSPSKTGDSWFRKILPNNLDFPRKRNQSLEKFRSQQACSRLRSKRSSMAKFNRPSCPHFIMELAAELKLEQRQDRT